MAVVVSILRHPWWFRENITNFGTVTVFADKEAVYEIVEESQAQLSRFSNEYPKTSAAPLLKAIWDKRWYISTVWLKN
jgi:hypothetical protein